MRTPGIKTPANLTHKQQETTIIGGASCLARASRATNHMLLSKANIYEVN